MNKQQFISYMDAPEQMTGADATFLNEVLKQFPYFQTAHLLYAKSLHNTQSIQYNNQLKTTAAYASDRKILYQLITNKKEKIQDVESILISDKPTIKSVVEEVVKDEILQKNIEVKVLETKEPEIAEDIKEIEAKEESKAIDETTSITDAKIYELEKEFLDDVAASVYNSKSLYELPIITKEENKNIDDLEPVSKKAETKEPLSFTDWLKNLSGENLTETHSERASEKISTNSIKKDKLSDFELIDKFISDAPKISKPKAEFYNPINMAKQSVSEDISFVSETLARIYELQGNYTKAINAYENLRLKYPEKRLYFATQIKNLKKLINQNNNK